MIGSDLRILEIILYSLVDLLPYLLLAIYPFLDKLRYSKTTTIIIILLLMVVQSGMGIFAVILSINKGLLNLLSLVSTIIYIMFYFKVIKADFGKLLFTLFMVSNISNFDVVSSKFIESKLFPLMRLQLYRWTLSLTMIIVDIIIFIPLCIFFKKFYIPIIKSEKNTNAWKYLWLIPITFYLLWFNTIYYNSVTSLEVTLNFKNVIFLFFINIGAFLVYYVVIKMQEGLEKNFDLEIRNHQLEMQSKQYENLKEHINTVRRIKHDFRHHMAAINGYLEKKEYDKLKEYINQYVENTSLDTSIVFCENYSANMLISYFNQLAEDNDIEFSAKVNLPQKISISDSDMSIILGNLLENAVAACKELKDISRKVIIKCDIKNNQLLLTVDNTYENKITKNKFGILYSTKHSGTGIGVESVKNIVKLHNGIIRFEQANNMFCVSIIINL